MLLHGVGLDRTMWARCVPVLSTRAVVVAPDLPGHGASVPVRGRVSLDDLAAGVLGHLGDCAHLVGFSLGALVAEHLALTYPDRVRSLVLVSAVARRTPAQQAAVQARYDAAERSLPDSAHASIQRWFRPSFRGREPQLARDVLQRLLANDRESYLACYRLFAEADAALWPQLGGISAPTLVTTGANDTGSTPQMTADLAAAIPHARAQVVPDAAHLLPLEQPAALSRSILDHVNAVPTTREAP